MSTQFNFQKHYYFKLFSLFKQFSLTKVQFQCQKLFHFKQFSFAQLRNLLLFDPWIGPYQVPPLLIRVDLGGMAMKGYSAFPKAPALLGFLHQIV